MKLGFIRTRTVVVLLAIAVLVSLGVTQYADAITTTFNERSTGVGVNVVNGTNYHNGQHNGVYVQFIFDGDRSRSFTSDWDTSGFFTSGSNAVNDITINNGGSLGASKEINDNPSFFIAEIKAIHLQQGETTVTFPENVFTRKATRVDNDEVSYSFIYDTIDPTFETGADFSDVELTVGDPNPAVPNIRCVDTNSSGSGRAERTASAVDTRVAGETLVKYTCTDKAGNSVSETKTYRVSAAIPTDISIASDNADPTKAKSGDIVTITFNTEEGSAVEGTIGGKNATFAFNGTSSTLARTLDGTETFGVLTFSFVQTDAVGNVAATQTVVRGAGAGTSVTADFAAPVAPLNISITSDNADSTKAKKGNIVTVLFDTEAGSTVEGTIGGKNATFAFNGTSSTLARTLDGTETFGVLTFSFVQTDATGNAAATQTVVRGAGAGTSVTADFTPPAIPINISIASNNAYSSFFARYDDTVQVTFDLATGSTFAGTISDDGGYVTHIKYSDAGTFWKRLSGNENRNDLITFSLVITDSDGAATTYTAVSGTGAGTSVTTDFTYPTTPDNISIAHNGAGTNAVYGDIVTVTFDTDTDATRTKGTIGGKNADYTLDGTIGKLTRTLDSTESPGVLAFSFRVFDHVGNGGTTQTVVKGDGAGTSVTAYFVAPAIPTDISIASDNADPTKAKSGDIVTITFDTVSGPTVEGTIDGKDATFAFSGTSSTLTRMLDGTETEGTPLTFSFVQSNTGGDAVAQTAVKGLGARTSVTADFAAPAAPIFTNSTATVSSSPVTLAGTADDGSTVTLYKDETFVATATATGGAFEFTGVELDEGSNDFTLTATDASSNVSAKSGALVITLDTAAPAAPIFTNSTATVSSSPVTLAGTAEADSTVTLYKDETSVATATATGGIFEFAGVTLAEERNSFTATATDAALNVSAKSGALVITLDTAAPAAPIFTNSTATVSSSPVTLAGTAEADSTVTLYKGETFVATATATGGAFEFAGVELAEERNSFTATATDASSNVSAKSGALVITLDTTAPVFATSTDTTDVTFGDTVPTLSTLCTDANTITVTNDAGSITFDAVGAKTVIYTCTDAAGNTAIQSVSYSVAAAPSTFNERASSSTSKTVVDGTIYHNLGLVWVEFDFTGDGTSVDRPRSSNIIVTNGVMLSASNSGTNGTSSFYHQYFVQPSSDGTVTVTYPANSFIINGASNDAVTYTFVSDRTHPTFEAGADFSTVELTVGDDFPTLSTLQCRDTYISTTSAPPSGSVNANLAGDYPVEYTCTDNADNSVTKTKTYRVLADFAAPAAPIFTNSTTTVSSSPVTLAGTAEADSTVTLYKDETFVATATATGGIFEFAGVTLAEERNSFTATATDAALNVSAKSGALVITLDTAAPAAPIFTNSTATVSSSPVTLAGTAEADSTVTLYKDETFVATATATGGIFEFAGVTLAEERNSFTATATDAALNVSAKSGALVITLDTAAPAAPIFTNSTATVSSSPVTLAGTAEADSTVTLYKDETFVATATATGGIFEFAGVTLAEERNSFTATATDAALNVSAKSGALVITLDTAAPAAPIFTNSTTTVSSSPVTLAGTAEADSTEHYTKMKLL